MPQNINDGDHGTKPPRKIIWIIGGFLILLICLIAFQGIVRGVADANGVDQAAPGGPNADPDEDDDMKVQG